MSQSINGMNAANGVDFSALRQQLADAALRATGNALVPGANETLDSLLNSFSDAALPSLEKPAAHTAMAAGQTLGGLSLGGLSLETLLDAVGMEQRRTETKAGVANMEARAEERRQVNEEKLKQIQEEVDKAKSRGFLDGLLKAFKYIGMALAAIGSIAMIAAGAVGLAAGGSGAALIAVGAAALYMLTDSIIQEATDGKAGIGPGFIAGKIAEACGAGESAVQWIKFGVDMAASIALMIASFGAASGAAAGNVAKTASDGAQMATKVAGMTAKIATIAGGVNTVAQSATSIASAVNERDISNLQAAQKRLQAILERIAQANELDLDHIKAMMQRSEDTLKQVAEIVEEGVSTNVAIMTGAPAMA